MIEDLRLGPVASSKRAHFFVHSRNAQRKLSWHQIRATYWRNWHLTPQRSQSIYSLVVIFLFSLILCLYQRKCELLFHLIKNSLQHNSRCWFVLQPDYKFSSKVVLKSESVFPVVSATAASVCGVRPQSPAPAALHPQESLPVQVLVCGQLHRLRVRHVCPHHPQHAVSGHPGEWQRGGGWGPTSREWSDCPPPFPTAPRPVWAVQLRHGHPQHGLHRGFHRGDDPQAHCLQTQGRGHICCWWFVGFFKHET